MSESAAPLTVRDVEHALDGLYPYAWAEPWDRVGLLAGDPAAPVTGIFVTLDPTADAIERAVAAGANVLLSHHPAFLEPPADLVRAPETEIAFLAASSGIALLCCHTNLDRAPEGADSLPLAAGLTPREPLERGRQPVALVSIFCPEDRAAAVVDAMTSAGAGRIGRYSGCAFTARGTGTFVAGEGARPSVGSAGVRENVSEARVEIVCDARRVPAVLDAARAAHPYEEPLIFVQDATIDRGAARLGRLCELSKPATLRDFAAEVGGRLGCTPTVWGDPAREVTLVATNSGSGGAILPDAIRAGASVLLTGEVRYHVALEAVAAGIAVIEAGHDVTEWPHVAVMASGLRTVPAAAGLVIADEPVVRWWTP
jgi:dinuclear metal center YbgI/SA1388 family protein